jgi:uncharacterized protein YjgD (DUF1641 family)
MAVWIKRHYKDIPEDKLDDVIKESTFDIKVMVETQESLLPFLEQKISKRSSSEGWFTEQTVYDFKDFIDNSIDFLIKEEKLKELTEQVKSRIGEFVQTLSSLDSEGEIAKFYYDLLWKAIWSFVR